MQIGHRILGGYDAPVQENMKTDGANRAEQTGQAKSPTDISGLKEGTVFRGEVLDIIGEKVTIALENRAQLLARLQGDVELGVGDRLLFSVKENNDNQILIKPVFDSLYSAETQMLEKALDATGLSPTEKNFTAAKTLMEAGMPLDKGTLVKLLSQSMKFEGTSMQTLAALNKMNIPVTAENIAQFERYQGYQHQFTGDIAQAADGMASFAEAFPQNMPVKELLSVAQELLDIFMPEPTEEGAETSDKAALAGENASETQQAAELTKDGLVQDSFVQEGTLPGDAKEASSVVDKQMVSANPVQEGTEAGKQTQSVQPEQAGKTEQTAVLAKEASDIPAANQEEANRTPLSQIAERFGMTKEETMNLFRSLSETEVPREQIRSMFEQSRTPEELLKNIVQNLNTSNADASVVQSVLQSMEFKNLFAEMIKKGWALNPKEMKDPKEIDDLYEKIQKQTDAFEKAIASKGGDTKNFNQNFQNMRQNMQFMEQLNQQMIYAQMPLKLSNQNANSELFVYADKRKLAQKKDGISVMLHLDMDHLGTTDIKVTLTGTNVNARFYLNDQESVDIVAGNMNQLAKQLADRGFSLTNEVVKRQPQESINQVVDEIIDENAERSIKRYTFDART